MRRFLPRLLLAQETYKSPTRHFFFFSSNPIYYYVKQDITAYSLLTWTDHIDFKDMPIFPGVYNNRDYIELVDH